MAATGLTLISANALSLAVSESVTVALRDGFVDLPGDFLPAPSMRS
jgi:hypothetical protein